MKKINQLLIASMCLMSFFARAMDIYSDATISSSMTMSQDIIIHNGATLTISNCTLNFSDNYKIQVKEGGKLETINAILTCDWPLEPTKYWQGIILDHQTYVANQNLPVALEIRNTSISKARQAISTSYTTYTDEILPRIMVYYSLFYDNKKHVYFDNSYNTIYEDNSEFQFVGNRFLNATTDDNDAVYFKYGRGLHFSRNTFHSGNSVMNQASIHIGNGTEALFKHNTFYHRKGNGVVFRNKSNDCEDVTFDHNIFKTDPNIQDVNYRAITFLSDHEEYAFGFLKNVTIIENTFENLSSEGVFTGILSRVVKSLDLVIDGNTIKGYQRGIDISNNDDNYNFRSYVQYNVIENFDKAFNSHGKNRGLYIRCNTFRDGEKAIVVDYYNILAGWNSLNGELRDHTGADHNNQFINCTYDIYGNGNAPFTYESTSPSSFNTSGWVYVVSTSWVDDCKREAGDPFKTDLSAESSLTEEIVVYPNPAQEMVKVQLETFTSEAVVQLFDMSGRLLLEQKITEDVTTLNIKDFDPGNYVLKVNSGHKSFSKRVVKL